MQVYRGLTIGTAKPGPDLLRAVPHHLVDTHDPSEHYHAGEFVEAVDGLVPAITDRGRLPVIAGGTAFYLEAYLFGLPGTPQANMKIREELVHRYESEGLDALRSELAEVDPAAEARIAPNDWYRVVRALEVFRCSGRALSTFQRSHERRARAEGVRIIGVYRDRARLYDRINRRVDEMIARGLSVEVAALLESGVAPDAPAMRAIGYREFVELGAPPWTDHQVAQATDLIKRNSRHYAKRQITFFSRLPEVLWVDADARDSQGRFAAAIA